MKLKSILLLTLCTLCFTVRPALAQDFKDPVAYMSFMGEENKAISKDLWSYISAVAHGKRAKKIEKRRKELITTTQNAKRKISRMPPFQGDTGLRDSVVAFLHLNYIVLKEDYGKIVDMEEISEQSYDNMEAFLMAKELANEKLDRAGEMLEEQNKVFADKHKINLTESKSNLSKKLEKAGDVFKYYNQVYLIFFKSYKQESYLIEAMQKGDLNALEQNKNSLLKFSEEGLLKLESIPRYKNDATLKLACIRMLDFYKMEAGEKIPEAVEFYLKGENMEKLKKAFDSKKQSELTQADVDQYNNAINDYNQTLSRFNNTNEMLNKMREKALDNWNRSVETFLDKQTPKK